MPLHGLIVNLLRLGLWLIILSAVLLPLERLFALRRQKVFRKQVGVDLGYYFLNGLVPGLLLGAPMAAVVFAAHRLIPGGVLAAVSAWPVWARAAAAMVAGETGYYWAHRASHEIPFLWRFHAIHHSAEHIDYLVNTRAHPVDIVFTRLCMLAPLYALGLVNPMRITDGVIPMAVLFGGALWGYFVHANVRWRLGPVEWLISTPGFHHWHHAMGMRRNCNYASMLPWLDRIFGSHYLPKTWPPEYGIPEPMPDSLVGQIIHPLREADREPTAPARENVAAG